MHDAPIKLVDDRGREFQPLTTATVAGDGEEDEARRRLIRRLRLGMKSHSKQLVLPQVIIAAVAFGGCCVGAALADVFGCAGPVGGFLLGGLIAWLFVRSFVRSEIAPAISASALAEGYCGACAHSLRGVPEEADGCLCCGECGCAWKRFRLTSPHWREATQYESAQTFKWKFQPFKLPPREMVTDGRNRFVRSCGSFVCWLPKETKDELGPAGRARLRAAIRDTATVRRAIAGCVVAIVTVTPAILVLIEAIRDPRADVILLATGLLVFGAILIVGLHFSPMGRQQWHVKALFDHGVCGGCGQMLPRPHAPEQDGCVVCANCRAAWRVAPARPPTAQEVERSASEGDA
jgi:hypothetical protein